MAYQVLARKYRPQRFADVIGQEHVTRTLKNAIEQQRIAHGYIFSGHRGIGKTTIARILAMALNCRSTDHPVPEPCGECDSCKEIRAGSSVDVIEIDAATNRGIDEIRELRDATRYRPARDRYKIWILDEAHQITDAAFNALLKTLEEPPGHVIFMMATTQPEDIPQTIRSRCQHFSFHAVKFEEIVAQLRSLAEQEQIAAEDDALALLAEAGDGSMRDALSIMDQAIACCGTTLTAETVRQLVGAVPSETLENMMAAVQSNSSEGVLRLLDRLIIQGQNPGHFARQMVRFLRNALVAKVAGDSSPLLQISGDERARAARVASWFTEEDLARFLQILLRTHSELAYKQEQRFHLELGLLKLVHAQRLLPVEELLSEAAARPAAEPNSTPRTTARESAPASSSARTVARPSPFASDVARKSSGTENLAAAAAPALETATIVESPASDPDAVRARVLAAVAQAGRQTLLDWMEAGQWTFGNAEVTVQVAAPEKVVALEAGGAAVQSLLNNAVTAALGRAARLRVLGGANAGGAKPAASASPNATLANGPGATARNRALQETVVRRMQEKFGAQIRTVIDYKK